MNEDNLELVSATTPTTKDIDVDAIPQELKDLKQWVCWSFDYNDRGELSKMPKNPRTGGNAVSTIPATWTGFTQASEAYMNNRYIGEYGLHAGGKYNGIGFVFSQDNDIMGFDIDHLELEDGELPDDVKEILADLNSYCEISPSGQGVHIICKAALPEKGRKKGNMEMYSEARYFTMTGNKLTEYSGTVNNCQEKITYYHKKYIMNLSQAEQPEMKKYAPGDCDIDPNIIFQSAVLATNGEKFLALYDGDWTDYPSPSEADLALCNMLAFWYRRDPYYMDAVFRTSGLYRPKWDEKHGIGTYGEITIDKAISSCPEVYNRH